MMTMTHPNVSASVILWGQALTPLRLSRMLGVEPWRHQAKGDLTTSRSGKVFVAKIGMWELSSSNRGCSSPVLEEHVLLLLSLLERNSVGSLTGIDGVEEALLVVYIGMSGDSTAELVLSTDVLRRVAALGLSLKTTIIGSD